jgi:hypothetical protein
MSLLRTRWAAIGAAVAITLGAGGIGIVSATVNSGSRTVFVPITPCRIMDTRPGFVVGPKTSPLGPEEIYTVAAHGTHGRCTLPNDASGLVLNVTATDATLPTFLAVWGDGARPISSVLNPSPGQPPTPNAVTTDLTGSGQFEIFNKQGNVNVFVDVVGYYADHNHDDRYYTKNQVDQISSSPFIVEGTVQTIAIEAGLFDDPDLASTLTVTAPGPGQFVITGTGNYSALLSQGLHPDVQCSLTDDGTFDADHRSLYEVWNATPSGSNERSEADLAITRVIDVDAAGDLTLDILCRQQSGGQRVLVVSRIVAHYVP